jgi:hypothetical protein
VGKTKWWSRSKYTLEFSPLYTVILVVNPVAEGGRSAFVDLLEREPASGPWWTVEKGTVVI